MVLLAVNYHYVSAEPPAEPRAIFPVTPDALRVQLELLAREFEFVSRDALLAAVEDGAPLPERGCLVTFDDGLRSHYELALPVLERLGVPAVFFVSGRPLLERRALHVHRVHHLRETLSETEFGTLLNRCLRELGATTPNVTDVQARSMYRYDELEAARTKFLLNVALGPMVSEQVVVRMFGEAGPGEAAFVDELYLEAEQVVELEHRHGAIGAHGYAHRPFATLDPAVKVADMEGGLRALARVTGRAPRMISYPYGSAAAVTPAVGAAAAAIGFTVGLTMERAVNHSLRDPLLLSRIDTNDAPGGRRPLDLAPRSRYFDEASEAVRA